MLDIGENNLLHDVYHTAYSAGGENSYIADLTKIVNCWFFYYPNSTFLLGTVPDLSYAGGVTVGGLGANGLDPAQWPTYTQWVAAFNAGVTTVAALYPTKIKVIDDYTILYGHPLLFNNSAVYHPSDAGHFALAQGVEDLFFRQGGNR
jgi:hypothetical protein